MSHDPTGSSAAHAESGKEGVVMAWGHYVSKRVANVIARLPFLVAFVRGLDPSGGKATGGVVRTLAGYKNFGFLSPRWNGILDSFIYEIAEVLEHDADRPVDELLGDRALMDKLSTKFKHHVEQKIWVVMDIYKMAHNDQNCVGFLALTQSETYKDKDGKDQKKPPKYPVIETTLEGAMKAKNPPCPFCFPEGSLEEEKDEHHAPSASKKVSPGEIIGAYLREAGDDIVEIATRNRQIMDLQEALANIADPDLRARFEGLNTPDELLMLLNAMKGSHEAFKVALTQLEEPGLSRAVNNITRKLRTSLENGFDQIDAAAAEEAKDIDARTTAVRRRMSERKGGEILDEHGAVVGEVSRPGRVVRFWRALTEGIL